jgi:hypothetical protein
MSDLDSRTIERMRAGRPGLREVPDERIKETYTFAWMRASIALHDLVDVVLAKLRLR